MSDKPSMHEVAPHLLQLTEEVNTFIHRVFELQEVGVPPMFTLSSYLSSIRRLAEAADISWDELMEAADRTTEITISENANS